MAVATGSECSNRSTSDQANGEQFTRTSEAKINGALFSVDWDATSPKPVTLSIRAGSGDGKLGLRVYGDAFNGSSFASHVDTGLGNHIIGVNLPAVTLAAGTHNLLLTDMFHDLGVSTYHRAGSAGQTIVVPGETSGVVGDRAIRRRAPERCAVRLHRCVPS